MPTISFSVERMGYAEQFVQRLQSTMPEALDELLGGIKDDMAANAPKGKNLNPKAGDTPLADSFYTIAAQRMGEGLWEGYIASTVPAKARAQEYGSGFYRPGGNVYPITPKNAKALHFNWPYGPDGEKFPMHPWYTLRRVIHPGVIGKFYIQKTLQIWRSAITKRFGDAIKMATVSFPWSG